MLLFYHYWQINITRDNDFNLAISDHRATVSLSHGPLPILVNGERVGRCLSIIEVLNVVAICPDLKGSLSARASGGADIKGAAGIA